MLDLLSRLIEDYESRTFSVPEGRPYETLRFLMEQNELRQADLMQIFGSRGRVCRKQSRESGQSARRKPKAWRSSSGFHQSCFFDYHDANFAAIRIH